MAKISIKLLEKREIAGGTTAFIFEKPADFVYKAGQFADFTILNPSQTDEEGNTRGFSLASTPYEDHLMIATRMRDTAFKRELKEFKAGDTIELDGPYGTFTLHNKVDVPAVFLTGGIGITPVRSIILQSIKDNPQRNIALLYSNRKVEDAAFLEELTNVSSENEHFNFIPVMTQPDESLAQWNGEKNHITKEMLDKYISDLTLPIFYISGPAEMVGAMRKLLNEAGVDDDNIRAEEFSGY